MGEEKSRDITRSQKKGLSSMSNFRFGTVIGILKENVQANAREKVKDKIFTDAMEAAADTLGILKDHKINTTVQLLEMFEHYETLKKMESQTLDNINDPLEPLKISSALKSELLKLQFRKAEKPESISPLDYTVIAALKEALEKRTRDNG